MGRPPIIFIGMHRSGTSMITRFLEELGLFVGKKKDENNEAIFFQDINCWLLRQCGGAWDNPIPIHYLLENKNVCKSTVDHIDFLMKSLQTKSFLGWGKQIRYHSPKRLDMSWGWKDPRNTFTLPLWLDLFPEAKVINIFRHGVDVANSLKLRSDRVFTRVSKRYNCFKPIIKMRPKLVVFTDSHRCSTMEGAFSLWEEYMDEARKLMSKLGNRAIDLKYEDFLEEPQSRLRSLAGFCGLEADDRIINEMIGGLKKNRAYAYSKNLELVGYSQKMKDRLSKFGY